jgi:hypothetical protein
MASYLVPGMLRLSQWALLAVGVLALLLGVAAMVGGLPAFLT